MLKPHHILRFAVLSAASLGWVSAIHGADRTWIGGNTDWIDGVGAANWTPTDEPDADDVAIFNTNNTVSLGSNNSIAGLTMFNGIDLSLNGNDLTVDGLVSVIGTSSVSTLTVPVGSLLAADSVTLSSGGRLILTGGSVSIVEEAGDGLLTVFTGSLLSGNGTITLGDAPAVANTELFLLSGGTLTATSSAPLDLFGTTAATLRINVSNFNGRVDLDNVNAVININRNDTLYISGNAHGAVDPYSSTMNLGEGATFHMTQPWQFDGTLNVNTGGIIAGTAGASAVLSGAALTQISGTINLDPVDTLTFDAPFTMTGGTLTNDGLVIFNADATIGAAAAFRMPATASSITVASGVTATFNQPNLDIDGTGLPSNVITIESGAILDLNLGAGADNNLTGTTILNGGTLTVTNSVGDWGVNRDLRTGADTGSSVIVGDTLTFSSGANVTVETGSTLTISAPVVFGSASSAFTGEGMLRIQMYSTTNTNTVVSVHTFDWDGTGSGFLHTITDGATFTINSPVFDTDGAMDDPINLGGSGAQLVVNGPDQWIMREVLTTNSDAAGTATIGGTARLVMAHTLNVQGNTVISAPITFDAWSVSTVSPAAFLTVNGSTTFAGGTVTGAGTFHPAGSNTVTANTSITVTNFNFDRGDWTIESGALLTITVGDYDPDTPTDAFDSVINLDSGSINASSGNPSFVMNGTLNFNSSGVNPIWGGEPLVIGNDASSPATVNVNSLSGFITSSVSFMADASVNIAPGATLILAGTTTFLPVNGTMNGSFTGGGMLLINTHATFMEATTLNMPGGMFDFDGQLTDGTGNTISILAPVTWNAANILDFGRDKAVGTDTLTIDHDASTGVLTVELDDPAQEWTLTSFSVLNLINDNNLGLLLAGSPVNLNGTVNVTGDVQVSARVDLAGTVNILTAGQPLRLTGGDDVSNFNTIAGAIINGPGILNASNGKSLRGSGTIHADIDFDVSAELKADNGTLTLTGAILDVGSIGTRDFDGVLDVVNPWDSIVANSVDLIGGELRGGAITVNNPSGITGIGLVSARVINNTRLHANTPLDLIIQTSANDNDWDGAANNGTLTATSVGTLELHDNAPFGFNGSVVINNGGRVFTHDFGLNLNNGSSLLFGPGGGVFQSTRSTNFAGIITVNGPATINIQFNYFLSIQSTAVVTLNHPLTLVSNNASIATGATFSGAGSLIVPPNSHLLAQANANIDVLLDMRGNFRPAGFDTFGRVDLRDYQQSALGTLFVEVAGTGLAEFDRLVVTGAAQLAGKLFIDLDGGFAPVVGNTFNIISASAGVSGVFDLVQQDPFADTFFDVAYTPTLVQLQVVNVDIWDDSAGTQLWSTGANWVDNSEPTTADALRFPFGLPPASRNVTLSNVETGLALAFEDHYTLNGGTLSLTGNHPVSLYYNNVVIHSTLAVAHPLRLLNPGTLTLNPALLSTPAVELLGDNTLRLSGTGNALNVPVAISGSPGAWTARLDLASSALIVATGDPADKAAKIALLIDQIAAGNNGGIWTGQGITSSTAAADTANYGVGLFDNALLGNTSFGGHSVDAGALLVSIAHLGDANIDTTVNIVDLAIIANNWQQPRNTWSAGDLDADGFVDIVDLAIVSNNWQESSAYGLTAGPLLGPFPAADSPVVEGPPAASTSVPEPATLGVLAWVMPYLLRRARSSARGPGRGP